MQTTSKARRQILRQSVRFIKAFKILNDKSVDKKGSKNLQKFLKTLNTLYNANETKP